MHDVSGNHLRIALRKKHRELLVGCAGLLIFTLFFAAVIAVVGIIFYLLPSPGPIQKAARDGEVGQLNEFLKSGIGVDSRCEFRNWTALHAAADAGQFDAAEFLINHGASINLQDDEGYTALALTTGAEDKGGGSKDTEWGRNKIAAMLIVYGADIHLKPTSGLSLRSCAARSSDKDLQTMLAEAGAEP